jgi:hypothetical protein
MVTGRYFYTGTTKVVRRRKTSFHHFAAQSLEYDRGDPFSLPQPAHCELTWFVWRRGFHSLLYPGQRPRYQRPVHKPIIRSRPLVSVSCQLKQTLDQFCCLSERQKENLCLDHVEVGSPYSKVHLGQHAVGEVLKTGRRGLGMQIRESAVDWRVQSRLLDPVIADEATGALLGEECSRRHSTEQTAFGHADDLKETVSPRRPFGSQR